MNLVAAVAEQAVAEAPTELKFKRGPFILTINREPDGGVQARVSDPKKCVGIAFGYAHRDQHVTITDGSGYHNLYVDGALFRLRPIEVAKVRALVAAARPQA